jgi:hypothetical protein
MAGLPIASFHMEGLPIAGHLRIVYQIVVILESNVSSSNYNRSPYGRSLYGLFMAGLLMAGVPLAGLPMAGHLRIVSQKQSSL